MATARSSAAPITVAARQLAIGAGCPVRTVPCAPWPWFAPDEIGAAYAALRSGEVNSWTGEQGHSFERFPRDDNAKTQH
jgi:hypothetical protein